MKCREWERKNSTYVSQVKIVFFFCWQLHVLSTFYLFVLPEQDIKEISELCLGLAKLCEL